MFPQHRMRTRDVRKSNRTILKAQIAERKAYDAAHRKVAVATAAPPLPASPRAPWPPVDPRQLWLVDVETNTGWSQMAVRASNEDEALTAAVDLAMSRDGNFWTLDTRWPRKFDE